MGSFYTEKSTPPAHRTGLVRPTTALPTPPVGVAASPWTWAKARSKLGALIRLCGDGAMSIEAKMGSFYTEKSTPPAHRTGPVRPTTALPTPPVGVPASPWTWAKARSKLGALIGCAERRKWGHNCLHGKKAPLLHTEPSCSDPPPHFRRPPVGVPASPWTSKARSKLGALIRLCGDGAVSNEAKMGSFYTGKSTPPAHRTGPFRPTTALPTPPLALPPRPGRRRHEAN
jgi:hypothetical protein